MAYTDTLKAKGIKFLQGTQTNLNAYLTSTDANYGKAVEGAFYLTNDTHRLYVGRKDATDTTKVFPVPVNEGLIEVASESALPTLNSTNAASYAGQFYLITSSNILAVASGTNWVQLNPDTKVKSEAFAVSLSDKVASVKHTITDNFDTQASTDTFTVTAGTGISLSVSGKDITINASGGGYTAGISAEQVTGGTTQAKVSYSSEYTAANGTKVTNDADSITFAAGTEIDSIVVSGEAGAEVITINAADQGVSDVAITSPKTGDTIKDGFQITVTTADTSSESATVDPTITIGKEGSTTPVHFNNNNATLSVYTVAQTDTAIEDAIKKKLQTADAMTFVGKAEQATDITGKNAHNGDTYKATADFPLGTESVKIGDLIVVSGVEDSATGVIASPEYVIVPSGNELQYTGSALTHGYKIIDNQEVPANIAGLVVNASDGLEMGTDSEDKNVKTVTVKHSVPTGKKDDTTGTQATATDVASTTDANKQYKFTAVTGVTRDTYGHVETIETTEITVNNTHNAISSIAESVAKAADSDTLTFKTKITDTDGIDKTSSGVSITSNTLTASVSSTTATLDLLWGEF